MVADSLVMPMLAHLALTAALYGLLTIARAPTAWGVGARADGSNPWAAIEPRISANLSNQFEWPLFFYVICILLIIKGGELADLQWWLSWIFVAGRIIHSAIQIFLSNIRLRGVVFAINFLAVIGMRGSYYLQARGSY